VSEIFFTADCQRVMLTRDQLRALLERAADGWPDEDDIVTKVFEGAPLDKAWIEVIQ